jgi:lipid-A-disaccharide synthase
MRKYIDHLLALLPFEPDVHRRLGGPPCTYVGHPLAERVARLRPSCDEANRRLMTPPKLLLLPGSRFGELQRFLAIFMEAAALAQDRIGPLEVVIPTMPHLADEIATRSQQCRVKAHIIMDKREKEAAFRTATAALAKSGTVTLELALAGVPMVTAYKVSALEAVVGRRIVRRIPSIILANLVLGENVVPELLQEECTAENLAAALLPLLVDSVERARQLAAFSRLDSIMQTGGKTPAARAADVVMQVIERASGGQRARWSEASLSLTDSGA